jgi:peptide deformylase
MIKPILPATDPRLRQKSKPVNKVDKKVLLLIKDLKDTLKVQKDPEGVGLAAPQIGKNLRVFIMKPGKEMKVVINPQIISEKKLKNSDKSKNRIMEGCLSLPHYYGPLKRSKKLTLKYLDEKGSEITEIFSDFDAQIILHEIDHLNGVLFVDRLLEQKKPLYELLDDGWEEVEI